MVHRSFPSPIQTLFAGFIAMIVFSSCASLTGFQDGRTLGEENGEGSISLNFTQGPTLNNIGDSVLVNNDIVRLAFPNIELGGRYGIIDKLDLTVKVNTNLNFALGAKYQLWGEPQSKFAIAAGAEAGTFGLFLGVWNMQVPLYFSFHPNDKITFYASPRYVYQFNTFGELLTSWNYLGGNTGILIGNKNKLGIDIGYYRVSIPDLNTPGLLNIGVGGKFFFGNNEKEPSSNIKKTKSRKKRK
jgi:hypothetical protein